MENMKIMFLYFFNSIRYWQRSTQTNFQSGHYEQNPKSGNLNVKKQLAVFNADKSC